MVSPVLSQASASKAQLIIDFANAIDGAVQSAYSAAARIGNPAEPEIVYELMRLAVPSFDADLRTALNPHGLRVAVRGFFCHQKPKVTWAGIRATEPPGKKNKRGSVEIGDLLIIVHCNVGGRKWRNALLLQAKKDVIPSSITPDAQFYLFDRWPDFWYTQRPLSAVTSAAAPRSVRVGSHSGAQCLFLSPNWRWPYPLRSAGVFTTSATTLNGSKRLVSAALPLAEAIYEAIIGGTGRQFRRKKNLPDPSSDWSQVVWDLIDTLRNASTKLAIAARNRGARASHLFFLSGEWKALTDLSFTPMSAEVIDAFGGGPPDNGVDRTIGEEFPNLSAVPTIEIVITDRLEEEA